MKSAILSCILVLLIILFSFFYMYLGVKVFEKGGKYLLIYIVGSLIIVYIMRR